MCYVLSLSQQGAPHPLAARPRLVGRNELLPTGRRHEFIEEIAIVGDLIEWTIFAEETQMYVFNWKTGVLIWTHCCEVSVPILVRPVKGTVAAVLPSSLCVSVMF